MADQTPTTNPSTLNDREELRRRVDGTDFLCDGEQGVYPLVAAPRYVFQYLAERGAA